MTNNNGWPLVPLGEVLSLRLDKVEASPNTEFNIAGVYSFGRGLFRREPLSGANTTYKHFNRLHEDDYVISQPKAWEGAIARVPAEFDGWFLSPVFPTFRASPDRLDTRYLEWFGRQSVVWDRLRTVAQGMGARRDSVHPKKFLSLQIPLPPLEEQRRIVARIDRLAAKIFEAQKSTQQVESECLALLRSRFSQLVAGAPRDKMGNVAPLVRRKVEPRLGEEYPELGVRSFGKGTFHKPSLDYLTVGTKKLYRIEPGDLVFSNVFAWEGAIAVSQPEDEGRVGSHRFITCVPQDGVVSADFLCFYFLTPEGIERIGEASPGGAGRNRTLGLKKLAQIDVPIPAYESQVSFGRLIQKIRAMQTVRDTARNELNAMLPSILDRAFKGAL